MEKSKVLCITQTCIASPSQWEGKLENGHTFYARHRHGRTSIEISKDKTNNVDEAINGVELYRKTNGGGGILGFRLFKILMESVGFEFTEDTVINSIEDISVIKPDDKPPLGYQENRVV